MKLPLLLNNKSYLRVAAILPMLGLLAFTGCANLAGTADNQNQRTNRVATYMEQSQEQVQPADSDEDPDYEWFY
jgi:uncharacterized membrane protein YebE (DUF533 family)